MILKALIFLGCLLLVALPAHAQDMTAPQYVAPRGFSISLHLADVAEAERIYGELSAGGTIQMPLAPTFWAARFGAFVDRFGIPWTINCEGEPAS